MRAIYVSVAHNDDATIAQFRHVEVFVDARAKGSDDVLYLVIFEDDIQPHALYVQDFAAQWQDCLEVAITALLIRGAGGSALNEIQFAAIGAVLGAVGELAGQRSIEHVFALDHVASSTGDLADFGRDGGF